MFLCYSDGYMNINELVSHGFITTVPSMKGLELYNNNNEIWYKCHKDSFRLFLIISRQLYLFNYVYTKRCTNPITTIQKQLYGKYRLDYCFVFKGNESLLKLSSFEF